VSVYKVDDRLFRQAARQALWLSGPATQSVNLGRSEIEQLVPHRDPFLLLDAITLVDYEQQGVQGVRRIRPDDPVFAGHFPDNPVYPGVLQIEMMGQLGLCLFELQQRMNEGKDRVVGSKDFRLIRIHDAAFPAPVAPGDELTVRALALENNGLTFIMAGQISRNETFCSAIIMEVYYV
jgi:3-hydroxyacyl-[acyl-carrier-protein] dehydratase